MGIPPRHFKWPHLNGWINALDVHVGLVGSKLTLFILTNVPHVIYACGCVKKQTFNELLRVPVTDDPKVVLELLGFDSPQAVLNPILSDPDLSTRMTCSLLCSSRHFLPCMARNTNSHSKFGPIAPLMKYVHDTYGASRPTTDSDRAAIKMARASIHRDIVQRIPRVERLQAAAVEQARLLGEVQVATWGRSLDEEGHPRHVPRVHDRWKSFVKLQGVLPLSQMAPDEAYARWKQFRDEPLAHHHDWQCLQQLNHSLEYVVKSRPPSR